MVIDVISKILLLFRFLSNGKEFSGEIFCVVFRKFFACFTIEILPNEVMSIFKRSK